MKDEEKSKQDLIKELKELRNKLSTYEPTQTKTASNNENFENNNNVNLAKPDLYRILVEHAFDAIYLLNFRHYEYVNPRFCEITGYSFEELTSPDFDIDILLTASAKELINSRYEARMKGVEISSDYQVQILNKNGNIIDIEVNTNSIGKVAEVSVLGIMRDVTERNKAFKKLEETERKLKTLISNLPGIAYRCKNDPNWTMEFISDGCKELTGYEPEQLINNNELSYSDIIPIDERDYLWNEVQEALMKKEAFKLTYRITTSLNNIKWVWEQGSGVFNSNGDLEAIEGLIIDITDRKQMEEVLRKSEEKYRNIFELSPELMALFVRGGG